MRSSNRHLVTQARRYLGATLLAGGLALLSACASTGKDVQGFDQITVAPGDTGNCTSSPCQVFLKIPAGTGTYEVTGNEAKVGVYPAGQTASLGSFWQTQAFQIQGMNVPKAYVYIPNQR
jgi:hypothetical protein